jgi:hypothetical protein
MSSRFSRTSWSSFDHLAFRNWYKLPTARFSRTSWSSFDHPLSGDDSKRFGTQTTIEKHVRSQNFDLHPFHNFHDCPQPYFSRGKIDRSHAAAKLSRLSHVGRRIEPFAARLTSFEGCYPATLPILATFKSRQGAKSNSDQHQPN